MVKPRKRLSLKLFRAMILLALVGLVSAQIAIPGKRLALNVEGDILTLPYFANDLATKKRTV